MTSPAALDRQQIIDDLENRWYIDPSAGAATRSTPSSGSGWAQDEVLDGDLDLIARPIDLLGINFYTRQMVGALEGERPTTWRGDGDGLGSPPRSRSASC